MDLTVSPTIPACALSLEVSSQICRRRLCDLVEIASCKFGYKLPVKGHLMGKEDRKEKGVKFPFVKRL